MRINFPRVLVLGHARHGKDTVCEILKEDYGFRFQSSSYTLAQEVVYPAMVKAWEQYVLGYKADRPEWPFYDTWQDCFADRANHRSFWFNALVEYNTPDKARLAKLIWATNDVYCGMRNIEEFNAVKAADLYDYCVWVDASGRGLPPEPIESCTVHPGLADVILSNNGSLDDLTGGIHSLVDTWSFSKRRVS